MSRNPSSTFTGVVNTARFIPSISTGDMKVGGDLTIGNGIINGMMPTFTVTGYSPTEFSQAVAATNYHLNTKPYLAEATSNDSPFLLTLPHKIIPIQATIESIPDVNGLADKGELVPTGGPTRILRIGLGSGFASVPAAPGAVGAVFDSFGAADINIGSATHGNVETAVGTAGSVGFGTSGTPTTVAFNVNNPLTQGDFKMTITYKQVPTPTL